MRGMLAGKKLRFRRLTAHDRVVIVAVDHGNVAGVVPGLETPGEVVKMAAHAGADGVLITPGILEQVIDDVGDLAVILRVDGCVSALSNGPMRLFTTVEEALEMGADGVVCNATIGSEHESEELEKVGRLAAQGRCWGMPLIAEMLSQRMMANHMDFNGSQQTVLPEDIGKDVAMAARIGVELGADAIKTRYSGDPESFQAAVTGAGRPILVAGGPRREKNIEGTLSMVDEVLQAGAAGVVFGRLVWQHPDPPEMLRALCALVHDDVTVPEALQEVKV